MSVCWWCVCVDEERLWPSLIMVFSFTQVFKDRCGHTQAKNPFEGCDGRASLAALYLWNLSFNQHFLLATGCGSLCFDIPLLDYMVFQKSCLCSLIYRVQTVGFQCMGNTYCSTNGPAAGSWLILLNFGYGHVGRCIIWSCVWCSFFQKLYDWIAN